MPSVKQACGPCAGTGLYHGFAEPRGVAVVCSYCVGRGWFIHGYQEFTARKQKRGIKAVQLSEGGKKREITYAEFEKKYPS